MFCRFFMFALFWKSKFFFFMILISRSIVFIIFCFFSMKLKHTTVFVFTNQKILIAMSIYKTFSAFVDVYDWHDFETWITPNMFLFCTKFVTLWNAFDYFVQNTIFICGCLFTTRLRVNFAQFDLIDIQKKRKEKTTMQTNMVLWFNLIERFTMRFASKDEIFKKKVFVDFEISRVLNQVNDNVVMFIFKLLNF